MPRLLVKNLFLATLFLTSGITRICDSIVVLDDSDEEYDADTNEDDSSSEEEDEYGPDEYEVETNRNNDEKYSLLPPKPCICGRSNANPTKIVGGSISGNHAWPWMAAIANISAISLSGMRYPWTPTGGFSNFCGGSIINDRYILTAGHCGVIMMKAGVTNFRIIVGDNRVSGSSSLYRSVSVIRSIRIHPRYDNLRTIEYDAALLELESPLSFNSAVLPVCLGQAGSPYKNRLATVAGWGSVLAGHEYQPSDYLKDTNVRVISNSRCNDTYASASDSPRGVAPSMMCAFSPATDACGGDSGGPLFLSKGPSTQAYRQIGIVSYGESCGEQYPGVYTRVLKILNWIRAFTKDAMYCSDSFFP